MMIRDTRRPDLTRQKELKVMLPLAFHIRLHSMKILTGKPIGAVVVEALDVYFREDAGASAALAAGGE